MKNSSRQGVNFINLFLNAVDVPCEKTQTIIICTLEALPESIACQPRGGFVIKIEELNLSKELSSKEVKEKINAKMQKMRFA